MTANSPDNDYETALSAWLSPKPALAQDEADLFGAKASPGAAEAVERVREFVRRRFDLSAEAPIMVSEVECSLPGCPPLETVVAFWTKADQGEKRHHFKLFKRLAEVGYDDLPFAWLKDTLVVPEGFGCECC
jgi:nitrate reductase delta subunit